MENLSLSATMLKHQPLSDRVADQVIDWIMDGRLKPGEKINSESLAKALGVSRTPVREALKSLELSGLVSSKPYVGTSVSVLLVEDLEEIYSLRKLLESKAIKESAKRITDAEIADLERIQAEIESILKIAPRDNKRIFQLSKDFHMAIYGASKMPRLCEMINSLWASLSFFRLLLANNPKYGESAIAEHRDYINALKHRDEDRLEHLAISTLSAHESEMPKLVRKYYDEVVQSREN